MSARQHTPLILTDRDGSSRELVPVSLSSTKGTGGHDEAWIQTLIFEHPQTLPLQEIDPSFGPLVPICMELDTVGAGYADALFLNPLGMPTLIECKLWRNPEARREVVGQILDYARALRKWGFSDLQREAARARRQMGFDLVAHMRDHGVADLDEAAFVDNVGRNLRLGRILLLIVGDGIREGVEAIADYLQDTTMQFTLGLVEAKVFELDDGRRIVQPRVLAKTMIVNRVVVETRSLDTVAQDEVDEAKRETSEPSPRELWYLAFWSELIENLTLDDADQPLANPIRFGNIFFRFQSKSSMWLTCYFSEKDREIGVFLGSTRTSATALEIGRRLQADREDIDRALGRPVTWTQDADGKVSISSRKPCANLYDDSERADQLTWFRAAINDFVNVLRPRIGAHLGDILAGR